MGDHEVIALAELQVFADKWSQRLDPADAGEFRRDLTALLEQTINATREVALAAIREWFSGLYPL